MAKLACEGWWEQSGMGRQPMERLLIDVDGQRLSGEGVDVVGTFALSGRMNEGEVVIEKQYTGKHQVLYHGTSEGEGVYAGRWSIRGFEGGRWSIRFRRLVDIDLQDIPLTEIK